MLLSLSLVLGASESQPHYHKGKLARYDIGPPTLMLSASDESRLRSGRSVQQSLPGEDGVSQRMIMVQDIKAPCDIVLGRIMDLDKYPKMVSGVDACATYDSKTDKGVTTVKSVYEISAVHMKLKYYMEHHYDPKERCMVFHLDYSKRSDLDDSVGYWYVEPTGRSSSRVYYSCECKLRGWVPPPVYSLLTKEALNKATTWVERESRLEYQRSQRISFPNPMQSLQELKGRLDAIELPRLSTPRWLEERREGPLRWMNGLRGLRVDEGPAEVPAS